MEKRNKKIFEIDGRAKHEENSGRNLVAFLICSSTTKITLTEKVEKFEFERWLQAS